MHAANSAAAIRYPDVQFDMVRLGIALYGFHPCQQTRTMIDLRPAMSVHARITDARLVPMSEGVSYGMNYRSPGSVKICTVPIGYADGLRRGLSGCTDFIVEGQRFRQVGNICMDQCMFEVDLRTYGARRKVDPQMGDEVIVVGRQGDSVVTIDDMANSAGHHPARGGDRLRLLRMARYVRRVAGGGGRTRLARVTRVLTLGRDTGGQPQPQPARARWCGDGARRGKAAAAAALPDARRAADETDGVQEKTMPKPHIPLEQIRAEVEACRRCPLAGRAHADGFRRGQPRGARADRGRGAGQERGLAGRAVRGRGGEVPERASGRRRPAPRGRVHRERAQMPPAGKP